MRLLAQFVDVLLLVGFVGAYFWWRSQFLSALSYRRRTAAQTIGRTATEPAGRMGTTVHGPGAISVCVP